SNQPDQYRAAAIAAVVLQEIGGLPGVGHEEVEVAVVVDVSSDKCSPDLFDRKPRPRRAGHVDKSTIAGIAKEKPGLRVLGARTELRRVVHDVSVDDGKIETAVVIVVQEDGAESYVR